MATVYRKTFTKPLPEGAEVYTRKCVQFARWKDANGRTRTERVTTGRDVTGAHDEHLHRPAPFGRGRGRRRPARAAAGCDAEALA